MNEGTPTVPTGNDGQPPTGEQPKQPNNSSTGEDKGWFRGLLGRIRKHPGRTAGAAALAVGGGVAVARNLSSESQPGQEGASQPSGHVAEAPSTTTTSEATTTTTPTTLPKTPATAAGPAVVESSPASSTSTSTASEGSSATIVAGTPAETADPATQVTQEPGGPVVWHDPATGIIDRPPDIPADGMPADGSVPPEVATGNDENSAHGSDPFKQNQNQGTSINVVEGTQNMGGPGTTSTGQ